MQPILLCWGDSGVLNWGFEEFGVRDLTQGSAMSHVHFSAQHDSLGCTDDLRAQFSRQARTTSPEQAVGSVWG